MWEVLDNVIHFRTPYQYNMAHILYKSMWTQYGSYMHTCMNHRREDMTHVQHCMVTETS